MNARVGSQRIGRFALLRELGRGAQATVWLAYDDRLDREVALKLLDTSSDELTIDQWLHEARAVSRLSHPHLVPVFEADEAGGRPYLVFEYVAGPTLAAHARERGGALPAREAVGLMLGVLDALAAAHERGIVHRDLKPSNVLVDGEGRARVMDFGIAARVKDPRDAGTICGTPGYISPEAARGAAPQPAMDLFAAGVMLAELLGGRRLLVERDPMRALDRVQREDLLAPSANVAGEAIDEALRAIVQRALTRDPALRTRSAVAMRQALEQWLQGGAVAEEAAADSTPGHATLDFLLRRMKTRADFPALSDAVGRIQRVANSENENLSTLADEILKDVALTNKLLRLVNSAQYTAAGGAVSTVSRAVALVGFAGIRNMALSLVLLEHMQDKRHAEQLKEEFLRALMAATLANELTPAAREAEESFLATMFQNLGRLLVGFYFPEEARQIRELAQPATAKSAAALDEGTATQRVLGLGFGDIGQGVARAWGLPDPLQRAMRVPDGDAPGRSVGSAGLDRQRWLGRMATEVADAMLADGANAPRRIEAIAERYGRALGIAPEQVQAASQAAQERLAQLAQAMQIRLGAKSRARRLLATPASAADADTLDRHTLRANDVAPLDEVDKSLVQAPKRDAAQVADMLAQGVQDITQHMVGESFKLNEVLRMILETMMRALGFRRVVFCLRDPRTNMLTGRFGLGDSAGEVAAAIQVPLRLAPGVLPDLFAAVCAKGADTLIADATMPAIAGRLPAWFTQKVKAPSFLLLPLLLKGAPFALIYADQAKAGGIELDEKALALLRTLRNQGVMAFRQLG
ncbi:MAG TPA: HDOD domain-containing protein [Burkholderiaceae bacterium]|nr:HDOD domain-containing protein [Burkholderiaceae bacterium]